jgi:hypothetical protein
MTMAASINQPQRIQLSRAKGWRMPANTVSVARPGPWGNDWVVWRDGGVWMVTARGCMHYEFESREQAQAFAVLKHRVAVERSAGFYGGATLLTQLAGKNLACWCKPGTPCHADTLLRLANPEVTHG